MRACLEKPSSCKQTHRHYDSELLLQSKKAKFKGVLPDLAVRLAALPDDLYPVQHVLPVLCLQQVLAEVLGGQSQGMLSFSLAVCNIHQAAPDIDWLLLFGVSNGCTVEHCLPLVLVEEKRIGAKNRKNPLPRTHLLLSKEDM